VSGPGARSYLKYGCFGCAGLVGLAVVVLLVVSGTALVQFKSEQVERREIEQNLPRVEPGEAGLVVLDLRGVQIEIVPADPGEPLTVEAKYDTKSYELIEVKDAEGVASFAYRLEFHKTRMFDLSGLRSLFGGSMPEILIRLPRDVPFALQGTFENATAELDLGGLWLTEVDLTVSKGGFEIDVSEPLAHSPERFEIDGSMGAVFATNLGNASPRHLRIHHGMGALSVDLRGAWVADASVEVTLAMGGGVVRLPRDVTLRGLPDQFARFNSGPEPEIPLPVLDMNLHFDMGDLQVIE
jgi:hypothetical protein